MKRYNWKIEFYENESGIFDEEVSPTGILRVTESEFPLKGELIYFEEDDVYARVMEVVHTFNHEENIHYKIAKALYVR